MLIPGARTGRGLEGSRFRDDPADGAGGFYPTIILTWTMVLDRIVKILERSTKNRGRNYDGGKRESIV